MNSRRKFIYDISRGVAFIGLTNCGISCNTPPESAFIDRLLPAPVGGGFEMENYWVWGSSVIKGEDGKPTHLFAATGTGPEEWDFDKTWNMVIPLKS